MDVGQAWISLCNRTSIELRTKSGWYCEMTTDRIVEATRGGERHTYNHSRFLEAFKDAEFEEVLNNDR